MFELLTAKPFLKWAGGKGQLLPTLRTHYPETLGKHINKYAEPFVGGGAVLFDILSNYTLENVFICDNNFQLINVYIIIKNQVENLIHLLSDFESKYHSAKPEVQQIIYYDFREQYNELTTNMYTHSNDNLMCAALFIFLNKTCFNGLYRVNRTGKFNVPAGTYQRPTICDDTNLRAVSHVLQNVQIHHGHYSSCNSFVDQNTFVYFDPPYRPISGTSSFTAYTSDRFDDVSQQELATFIHKLSDRNALVMCSNSDPMNTNPNDMFFDELYKNYNIFRIEATRNINRDAKGRGKISEILIKNF